MNWFSVLLLIACICYCHAQTTDPACPTKTVINLGFGQTNPIPMPQANITFDATNEQFVFDVAAAYLGENYAWVVDFESWNAAPNRAINDPNNCENRIASSFTGAFSSWWNSADNANSPGALNTDTYLPYGPQAVDGWVQSAASCDTVRYHRSFPFSSLVDCSGKASSQLVTITFNSVNMTVTYAGTLKVTVVQPKNAADSTAGYNWSEFAFPFSFSFNTYIPNVVSQVQDNPFNVYVTGLALTSTNNLELTVETYLGSRANTTGDYLITPQVTGPAGIPLNAPVEVSSQGSSNAPCTLNANGLCVQTFKLTSSAAVYNYAGNYVFSWSVEECTTDNGCADSGRPVTATVPLQLSISGTQGGPTITLQSALTIYDGTTKALKTGAFYSGETVVIRDALVVQPVDGNQFVSVVANAWLCFSTDSSWAPTIDPTNGKYGCSQAYDSLTATNIVQLVANNVPTTASRIQAAFNTNLLSTTSAGWSSVLPYTSTVGLSFSAQPISTVAATYWIQVDTQITSVSGQVITARKLMSNTAKSSMVTSSFIMNPSVVAMSAASPLTINVVFVVIASIILIMV